MSPEVVKKEFLSHLQCQTLVLLKRGDRTCEHKELPWGHEKWPIIYFGAGGIKEKGRFPKGLSYAREYSQDLGALAIIKLKLFFPLAKH